MASMVYPGTHLMQVLFQKAVSGHVSGSSFILHPEKLGQIWWAWEHSELDGG